MALDGTLFTLPDTPANEQAFGRSSNQYGKGAYPQARAVFVTECGSHASIGLHIGRYDEAELHGAYALLPQLSRGMLLMHDANFFCGAYLSYPWVQPVYRYRDLDELLNAMQEHIIEPTEKRVRELPIEKAKRLESP